MMTNQQLSVAIEASLSAHPARAGRLLLGIRRGLDQIKVLDTTRQVVPEGEDPEETPETVGLQGLVRRPTPLWPRTRDMRTMLREQYRQLRDSIMQLLEATGVLEAIHQDAAKYMRRTGRAKGPEGRGGAPLGEETQRVVRRLWDRGPLEIFSEVIEGKTGSFSIEAGVGLTQQYIHSFNAAGRAAQYRLGVKPNFDLRNPYLMDTLSNRANLLSGDLGRVAFDRIRTVVAEEFYLQGKGPLEVARSLRREFDWMTKVRAERIARTETLSVMSEAQNITIKASGVQYKRWLTTLDLKERPSHFAAHGQIQLIDEPFNVGEAKLMYPGDISEHPEEVVNCRCDHLPVVLADQKWNESSVWRGDVSPGEFARTVT